MKEKGVKDGYQVLGTYWVSFPVIQTRKRKRILGEGEDGRMLSFAENILSLRLCG